jgi:hypothetical protein
MLTRKKVERNQRLTHSTFPSIDNDHLSAELFQTVTNLKTSVQPSFTDDHLFEKIQSSINVSLVIANDSEPLPTEYNQYEQQLLNKISLLNISLCKDGTDYFWLQVLVYPVFT